MRYFGLWTGRVGSSDSRRLLRRCRIHERTPRIRARLVDIADDQESGEAPCRGAALASRWICPSQLNNRGNVRCSPDGERPRVLFPRRLRGVPDWSE